MYAAAGQKLSGLSWHGLAPLEGSCLESILMVPKTPQNDIPALSGHGLMIRIMYILHIDR